MQFQFQSQMRSRLLWIVEFLGLALLSTIAAAAVVALWHMIDTPQPLESMLPGEARIYRWKRGHIFYKVLGAVDAPPLVLLHKPGISASAYEMRQIMKPLAQWYRVYAPDLLGFGLSDRPRTDYSPEVYTALCRDFLTDEVKQPAIVLASGLSCNYAVAAAAGSPELCKGLVLLSPTALFTGGKRNKQGLRSELVRLIQVPMVGSMLYPLLSTRSALRYELERANAHYMASELDHLYATTHQLGAQYAPMALLAGKLAQDASRQFEMLQQPTLIVWGTHALNDSRYLASQQHLAARPAQVQVVLVQDSGISVQEERPEAVIANVQEWSNEKKVAAASIPQATASEAQVATTPANGKDAGAAADVATAGTAEAAPDGIPAIEAYCVKCKKKVTMLNAQKVIMKNGRPATRGICPVCGTGLYRIGQVEKE
jgi:pimeloyl-ACP methyl ester carboxylesterase